MVIILGLGVLGLCLGSFVNALVWRLHEQVAVKAQKNKKREKARLEKLSIVRGRSMCSHCGHELAAKDLVPVVSWLWLRGKCRYCHQKIEDNPLPELAMPVVFILSYLLWPVELHGLGLMQFCFWLAFLVGFVALTIYDLRWYLLPDKIVFPLIVLAIAQVTATLIFFDGDWQTVWSSVWGVLAASGMFFIIYQISDGTWIGGGDVKLGIVLGLLIGGPIRGLLLLFLASALGTLASLPLLIAGKAKQGTLIPFGPFLLMATVLVVLFGGNMTDWLNHFAG